MSIWGWYANIQHEFDLGSHVEMRVDDPTLPPTFPVLLAVKWVEPEFVIHGPAIPVISLPNPPQKPGPGKPVVEVPVDPPPMAAIPEPATDSLITISLLLAVVTVSLQRKAR
jgi:hypothetical protein